MASAYLERFHQTLLVEHVGGFGLESRLAVRDGDGRHHHDVGEVLEYDRPRRLSYTFHHVTNETTRKERPSRVTFVLEAYGKLIKLTLTHQDFAEGSMVLDRHLEGLARDDVQPQEPAGNRTALAIPVEALVIAGLEEVRRA